MFERMFSFFIYDKCVVARFKSFVMNPLNPNYALGFRHESVKCKENGNSTVLLKLRRGHHHDEHQKSWTFSLSKQFQLVIDILMQI